MKLSDMRALKPEDFAREIESRKRELMELRFQGSFSRIANPHRLRQLRREVAQLSTLRREQQLNAQAVTSQPASSGQGEQQ